MIPYFIEDSAISDKGNNTDPNEIELASDIKYVRIRLGNADFSEVEGLGQAEKEKKTTLFQKDISKPLTNATAINLAQLERTNIGWRFCFKDAPMSMEIEDMCNIYGMSL